MLQYYISVNNKIKGFFQVGLTHPYLPATKIKQELMVFFTYFTILAETINLTMKYKL